MSDITNYVQELIDFEYDFHEAEARHDNCSALKMLIIIIDMLMSFKVCVNPKRSNFRCSGEVLKPLSGLHFWLCSFREDATLWLVVMTIA